MGRIIAQTSQPANNKSFLIIFTINVEALWQCYKKYIKLN